MKEMTNDGTFEYSSLRKREREIAEESNSHKCVVCVLGPVGQPTSGRSGVFGFGPLASPRPSDNKGLLFS